MKRRDFLRMSGGAAGGAAAVGGVGSAAAQETKSGGTTHTVEMTDQLVYEPKKITIAPGDTVEWKNVGSVGHSVTAYEDKIPKNADYWASGGFKSEQAARNAYPQEGNIAGGESYKHTFETTGTHEYFCIPHEAVGMVGSVVVEKGAGQESGGVATRPEPNPEHMGVPFQAHFVGLATILAIVASLIYTFFALKYGETPHSGYPEQD
ncbi:MAG: plastocyanin/azurin family copper-binding protein [Halobacteriales archaeon]